MVKVLPFDDRVVVGGSVLDGGGVGGGPKPPCTGSGIAEELIPKVTVAMTPPENPLFS